MTQSRKWSLMAALVAVAVFVGGWFLLIAPKRSDAANLKAQDVTAQAANEQLRAKLVELQALAPELPKKQAEFAAIRRQIPDNPALPDLISQLRAAATKAGVTLTTVAPSTPVVATDIATAATPSATGAAAPSTEQLLQVPLALTVSGSYSELEDYVDRLEGLSRAMLVSGFTLGAGTGTGTSAADLTLSLTGRVFMVHTAAAVAATPTATGTTTGTDSTTATPAPTGATAN
jgi:Tfp pilus assembly protein PilO